ncbi:MAG: hypothetical protein GF313_04590 [Caldithrix sp.]|nr:hypothetical protein [Caldithrix sp.]
MKFLSIILITFRESLAKKIFVAFFALSTLVSFLLLFAVNLDIVDGMQSAISIFGQEIPERVELEKIIYGIEGAIAVLLFSGGIFLSLFATLNLTPSLLEEGYIDLFISKPLHRWQILLGRYLGGLSIVAFNILYLIIFSGIILSTKSGIWNSGFFLAGLIIILTFATLYALMTFINICGGNGPVALMITYFIIFISPLLLQRDRIYALLSSKFYAYFLDGLYYILPKTAELGNLTQKVVRDATINSWMPVWSSVLFIVVTMLLSFLIFNKKDF